MGGEKQHKTVVSELKRVAKNHSVHDTNYRKNFLVYEIADRRIINKQHPCEIPLSFITNITKPYYNVRNRERIYKRNRISKKYKMHSNVN